MFLENFESVGVKLDLDHLHTKIGMTVKQVISDILKDSNLDMDVDSMVKNYIDATYDVYEQKAVLPDGLTEFVENCKNAGLKIGVASGTPSNILKMVLKKFDFMNILRFSLAVK